MAKEPKKSIVSITQVVNNKVKIHEPESDRLMSIFTKSGKVQLVGPKADLMKFKKQVTAKENRHTFLECPPHLFTHNPVLEAVTVLPAETGIIIIADPTKNTKLALPAKGLFIPPGRKTN